MTGLYPHQAEADDHQAAVKSETEPEYVRRLEHEYAIMQQAMLTLTTKYARLQFRVRQILQAAPCERYQLLKQLEHSDIESSTATGTMSGGGGGVAADPTGDSEMRQIERDLQTGDRIKRRQSGLLERLRQQFEALAVTLNARTPPEPEPIAALEGHINEPRP